MVPPLPTATFVVIQPQFLLELLVILLDFPAALRETDETDAVSSLPAGRRRSIWSVLALTRAHSTSSQTSLSGGLPSWKPWDGCTRAAQKRDFNRPLLPSRQPIVFHPLACCATVLADKGR